MDRQGTHMVLQDLVTGHRTEGMEGVDPHVAPEPGPR